MFYYIIFFLLQIIASYENETSVSIELVTLSDRLYAQIDVNLNNILAPVILTANIMNSTLVENVSSRINSIGLDDFSEIIQYNAEGLLSTQAPISFFSLT